MIEQLKTADHYLKAIAKFSLFFKTEEDDYDSSQSVSNNTLRNSNCPTEITESHKRSSHMIDTLWKWLFDIEAAALLIEHSVFHLAALAFGKELVSTR